MSSSIVRGRHVVCKVTGRHEADVVDDGAVFQRDGTIVDVGSFADISARHQADEVLGSFDHVVLPGFVNAHHHVGLTPLQLGSLDQPLELWWITRMGARDVDPYLDTLHSAFEMIESGVTTVQHIHGMVAGEPKRCVEAARRVLQAYDDVGMRVSYSYEIREQNPLAYEAEGAVLGHLPQALASALRARLHEQRMPLEDHFLIFEELYRQYDQHDRIRIQLAPANLHLCSDRALEMSGEYAARYGVPMHIHLVESALQMQYAERRTGTTALTHLHSLGLLGPRLTLGHGVWLTSEDIELAARTGTHICHNCSSNLRLRSGIAPLNHFEESGVRVAIGIDEAGINDDRDMLQEMRMVLNLHREPGLDDKIPTAAQVLRMATEHGAETTPFGATIGTLEPGRSADMVLMKWGQMAGPYLDPQISAVDAIVHRAKPAGVDTVLVGGIPILRAGRILRLDKDAALADLAASLASPLTEAERERRELAKSLYRPFKKYWEGYAIGQTRDPFHSMKSKDVIRGNAVPRTLGLAHLLLQTSDIERAERFYVGVLGFTVRKRERFDETRPLVVTHQGLGLTEGGPGDGRQVEHIAFRVDDVRSLATRIRDAGVPILEELGPGAYGMTIYVSDPDGNKIELFEEELPKA